MSKAMIQTGPRRDVTFSKRNVRSNCQRCLTIHINEGDNSRDCRLFWSRGNLTLVQVINLPQVPSAGTITVDGDVIYQDRVTLKPALFKRNVGISGCLPTLQLDGSNDRRRKCNLRS